MWTKALLRAISALTFEEMLAERNPELGRVLEELLVKILTTQSVTDRAAVMDMDEIRRKYAVRREAFVPLHQIFGDAPPAADLVKKLIKT